jgi:hypothetical protein
MATSAIRCPVLGWDVVRVTDFERHTTSIICEEYEDDGTCRVKVRALQGGPLGQVLERPTEHTLAERSTAGSLRAGYVGR